MSSNPPNQRKTVCLQDIADAAGVSRATVSLALRNHTGISLETRARIKEIAERLGYKPNPLISALMTYQRTSKPARRKHLTLAMLLRFSRNGPWESYMPGSLLAGAAARAEQHGYNLEQFWLDDLKMNSTRLNKVLYQRRIPGVIIAPLPVAHGHVRLDWSEFSAVAIGFSLFRPILHRVTTNRIDAMLMAVRRLRRLGYRRLGFAMKSNQDARVDHHWSAALFWVQQQTPRSLRVPPFIVRAEEWSEQKFARWYNANKPDVILAYDPDVICWLERLGKRVPVDVGFVQLWIQDQSPNYTGIYHNPPAMGAAAVDMLVAMINRNERGVPQTPQTVLLEASWVDGDTTRPRS